MSHIKLNLKMFTKTYVYILKNVLFISGSLRDCVTTHTRGKTLYELMHTHNLHDTISDLQI